MRFPRTTVEFAAHLGCSTEGGRASAEETGFRIEGAKAVTLILTAATSFAQPDPMAPSRSAMHRTIRRSWTELVRAHAADHQPLFRQVSLELDGANTGARPTDERLAAIRNGETIRCSLRCISIFGATC